MKSLTVIIISSLLTACNAEKPIVQYDSMVILTNEKFMVGSEVTDLPNSISNLGPPSDRQIDISTCGLNIRYQTITKAVDSLKAAGFSRIGFVLDSDRDTKMQALCANYAIKGTSVEILDSFEPSSGASVPYLGC